MLKPKRDVRGSGVSRLADGALAVPSAGSNAVLRKRSECASNERGGGRYGVATVPTDTWARMS